MKHFKQGYILLDKDTGDFLTSDDEDMCEQPGAPLLFYTSKEAAEAGKEYHDPDNDLVIVEVTVG